MTAVTPTCVMPSPASPPISWPSGYVGSKTRKSSSPTPRRHRSGPRSTGSPNEGRPWALCCELWCNGGSHCSRSIEFDGLTPLTVVIRAGQEPVTVVIGPDGVETSLGDPGTETAVQIEGDPEAVYSLLAGTREMDARVSMTGPEDSLARFRGLVERASRPAAIDGRV